MNKVMKLLDIHGVKRSLWLFVSDYVLFLDNKFFALARGMLFNVLAGRVSVAYIHKGCEFYSFRDIVIGRDAVIKKGCRLNGPLVIGDCATIDERVVLTGPTRIGMKCHINYGAWIDRHVEVDDYAGVGHRSFLIGFTHDYSDPTFRTGGALSYYPIRVGKGAWVGANVVILKGVTIGQGAIVGAGSVVTKNIPDNVLAAGNPCRIIRHV